MQLDIESCSGDTCIWQLLPVDVVIGNHRIRDRVVHGHGALRCLGMEMENEILRMEQGFWPRQGNDY